VTAPAAARERARWTLRDDGVIDLIAVQLAAAGTRQVALTRAERRLAAALILAAGCGTSLIAARLHLSGAAARHLAASLRARPCPAICCAGYRVSPPPPALRQAA
jgi:DNA-binding CsgD family transcriptional regulator